MTPSLLLSLGATVHDPDGAVWIVPGFGE